MPRFAANLSMLFNEVGFLDRFEAAARAGFRAVEFMSPYEHPAREVARRLVDHGLQQVLFNMPAGDRPKGDRGIACQPHRVAEFRESVKVAIDYALELKTPIVNCLAGIVPPGLSLQAAEDAYAENLAHACEAAARVGLRVAMEPLNPQDFPGFLLTRTDQAAALIDRVGAPNLCIEYDVYHAQRAEGDLAATLRRHLSSIGHMQVADVPTRAEPGTGEIRFDYLFDEIDRLGYEGWIGCDYHPSTSGDRHLDWVRRFL